MRVLHIITGLKAGGAEQQLRQLLRHLPPEAECDVVTLTSPGLVADGLRADGVRVRHLGMSGNRDLRALPRLVRLIRAGGYDLVHTHLYRACLYGRIAARLAGVRAVVASEHSLNDAEMEGRRRTAGVRALYLLGERLGRVTVAVSPTVAEDLRAWGVPRSRIRVIPVGFDPALFRFDEVRRKTARNFYGLPEDAYVVGGVGRLIPGKRFEVLVRTLPHLPAGARLLLAGDGPEKEALWRTARELGVADRVVMTGERPYVPDPGDDAPGMPDLMSAMDVLAAPSAMETYGMAVVEALAAGLPVLYTAAPAVSDLPADAVPTAWHVPCSAEQYGRELLRLYAAHPGERTVPDVVQRNSIQNIARQTMDLYAAVLSDAPLEVRPR
ncbi:glycosyl transferase [Streptomyces cellostaticus]|uniref:Glycosyl transferase n=1 Tax=Streptomyces cellostaticus TaxID=67285 RepID=A0A124HC97_9ACTN|nr:glycosyltransferase [Streptomyces cellostaticus]KUM93713.1 glycosyl transferase [Streptomyces cellostaticus]GHI07619.1 glycosyl transferase [Streptomyces cellostaticus]